MASGLSPVRNCRSSSQKCMTQSVPVIYCLLEKYEVPIWIRPDTNNAKAFVRARVDLPRFQTAQDCLPLGPTAIPGGAKP